MAHAQSNLRQIIEEVQEYEKKRHLQEICAASTVSPFNDGTHAGVIAHVCVLKKGHDGDCKCRIPCNYTWRGK